MGKQRRATNDVDLYYQALSLYADALSAANRSTFAFATAVADIVWGPYLPGAAAPSPSVAAPERAGEAGAAKAAITSTVTQVEPKSKDNTVTRLPEPVPPNAFTPEPVIAHTLSAKPLTADTLPAEPIAVEPVVADPVVAEQTSLEPSPPEAPLISTPGEILPAAVSFNNAVPSASPELPVDVKSVADLVFAAAENEEAPEKSPASPPKKSRKSSKPKRRKT